jgi:hypothetical protein
MRSSVFDFKDYREFILEEITSSKLSYGRFAKKYPGIFTEIALKKLLSRGRTGLTFRRTYSLSDERFSEFLSQVRPKLSSNEVHFLALLKVLNDSEAVGSKTQTKFHNQISEILNEKRQVTGQVQMTKNETYIYRALSTLPSKSRIRTEREIFTLVLRQMARLERSPEVMRIMKVIQNRIPSA